MSGGSRRAVSAILFVVLGLVAAFAVSAIAGLWDDEPAETGLRALGRGAEDRASVRVEVLNGAGKGGLARMATHRLRADGFDVVFFGNADRFDHAHSTVIDRTGEPDRARAVAASLGIDSVLTARDSSLMLEVTVVLGADWPPPPPTEEGWSQRLRELIRRDSTRETFLEASGGEASDGEASGGEARGAGTGG